jgi:hypothetical protein
MKQVEKSTPVKNAQSTTTAKQVGRPKKNFTKKSIPLPAKTINDVQITTETYIVYLTEYNVLPNNIEWFNAIPIDLVVSKSKDNLFKNCFICVMHDKNNNKVNIKICKNGTFQLTGCKHWKSCEEIIIKLLNHSGIAKAKLIIRPVMCNVKFFVGKQINILNALHFFNDDNYQSIFFAYKLNKSPALNIKSMFDPNDFNDITLHVINYTNDKHSTHNTIDMKTFIKKYNTSTKDMAKMTKDRFISIMLFSSGNCILSGVDIESIKKFFDIFLNLIVNNDF